MSSSSETDAFLRGRSRLTLNKPDESERMEEVGKDNYTFRISLRRIVCIRQRQARDYRVCTAISRGIVRIGGIFICLFLSGMVKKRIVCKLWGTFCIMY